MIGLRRAGAAVALLAGVGAALAAWQLFADVDPGGSVDVKILPGSSTRAVAARLEAAGVVRSALVFRLTARLSGRAARLQSGYYRFSGPADTWEVLDRLRRGDVVHFRVTVPEGLRVDEILALLAGRTETDPARWRAALEGLLDGREAEGRLLPETYVYFWPIDPERLLRRMLESHEAFIEGLSFDWVDVEGLRTVASIVEKETSVDAERPLVAAVIRNRLARGMRLQMDPTVIYGIRRRTGGFSGNLTRADLRRDSPWNTYTRRGLPATPICNPGAASLAAAASPADVDYLYFVADGSGGHVFASTLAEHRRNVARWMRIERGLEPEGE